MVRISKTYIPKEKEKYMCAKHKKFFTEELLNWKKEIIKAMAKIESEDTIIANLKFKNGSIGVLEATTATRPMDIEGSLSVLGSEGIVEISGFAMNKIIHPKIKDVIAKIKKIIG